jgi:hypothetical protein
MGRDALIRQRAYQIWEEEGRPEGKAEEHWERARQIVEDEAAGRRSARKLPNPRPRGRKGPKLSVGPGAGGLPN